MKIGLLDVDMSGFPNLALMKISAYHKAQRVNNVGWYVPGQKYDIVYMAKVFRSSPDPKFKIEAYDTFKGGTGYDLHTKLQYDVEHMYPDYGLYPGMTDTAYGFMTRGCPRACDTCSVTEKEGRQTVHVADLDEFWRGQKNIELLDPNMTACPDVLKLMAQLVESGAVINFNQGLDIRLMTGDIAKLLRRMKVKSIHFAWDYPDYEALIVRNLQRFMREWTGSKYKLRVYVLIGYNTSFDYDLERVIRLREMGYDPYIMPYDQGELTAEQKKLRRWVNNKRIWRTCERLEDYDPSKEAKPWNPKI